MSWRSIAVGIALAASSPALASQQAVPAKPLFAASDVIRITLRGPVSAIVRSRSTQPRPARLELAAGVEAHPIRLSARGITRRQADICQFPPLRVEFTSSPPAGSLFAGQRRLKLVTHCRTAPAFQKHVLLEHAAYRMFNVLTPASFRVRLAMIDYVEAEGRPIASRYGFFIEDIDDVARRNGAREAKVGDTVPASYLRLAEVARYVLFQHMLGNHDWSMHAGPKGAGCCHNSKLIGPQQAARATLTPVPYDFDFSGFVDAPYATPPDALRIATVRQRRYRGSCAHNRYAEAAAGEFRAARAKLLAELHGTPGLEDAAKRRAADYLERFFADIATDSDVAKLLKACE